MKKEDAEEFTQSLGQIVGGSWRQIALAKRLGVPKALDLSVDEWVNKRLGGYIKLAAGDRRPVVAELKANGLSAPEIGEVLGVNEKTVDRDLRAMGTNVPEGDVSAIDSGTNVPAIDAIAALAASDQMKATAKATKTRKATVAANVAELERPVRLADDLYDLHLGDFRAASARIPDESVELVFTDPPYDDGSVPLFADAARIAARILKRGGSMLCYCGHLQLPRVLPLMAQHLRYWWLCQHYHDGGPLARMREFGVIVHGKPMVWFVKDTRGDKYEFVDDAVPVAREKTTHPWQQAESIASYYIGKLTPAKGTVVDFFAGGATTLVAAEKLGRQWIGFENDERHYTAALARMKVARVAA